MASPVSPRAVQEHFEVEEATFRQPTGCSSTQRVRCFVGKAIIGLGFAWMVAGPLLVELTSFRISTFDKTKTQMACAAIAIAIMCVGLTVAAKPNCCLRPDHNIPDEAFTMVV